MTPNSLRFSRLGKASTNARLQLTVSLFTVTPASFKHQRLIVKTELFLEPDPPTSHLKASYLNFAGKILVCQELRGGIFPSICSLSGLWEDKSHPGCFSLYHTHLGVRWVGMGRVSSSGWLWALAGFCPAWSMPAHGVQNVAPQPDA